MGNKSKKKVKKKMELDMIDENLMLRGSTDWLSIQPDNNLTSAGENCSVPEEITQPTKSAGPPNRMNDLIYRDWMKYQKSFFRYSGTQKLIEEAILFFTKAVWEDGNRSRSLILGFDYCPCGIEKQRTVDVRPSGSWKEVVMTLTNLSGSKNSAAYDFVLLDLRMLLKTAADWDHFRADQEGFFSALKCLLHSDKYLMVLVEDTFQESPFPVAWAMASIMRDYFKLRDEKVALLEEEKGLFYCLCFQAADDQRPSPHIQPGTLSIGRSDKRFPDWIIPKPPPRKKDEVLHPAKYPETLCEEFISDFTEPGESVIDPMVGTGSSVRAAMNIDRNAVGIELNESFARIAQNRTMPDANLSLFEEKDTVTGEIIVGDSMRLKEISELKNRVFSYCLTSPPYWNMLKNKGSENQSARRQKGLQLDYSDTEERDLGNIEDYDVFLGKLVQLYENIADFLTDDGFLTVVVKNVKRERVSYPLAWDLTALLASSEGKYEYVGSTLWCQDDIGLKPFAIGIHWISNTLHHYCLHFRKRLHSDILH